MTQHGEFASTSIPNEAQLLLCCARTRVGTEMRERIRALVSGPLNWDACYVAAGEHGILPLLCRNLLADCPDCVPENWLKKFKADLHAVAQRNLFLTAEMLRLAGRFRAESLLAIPYKGPLLATEAYGNLGLRQFADLDFAIRQRDIPRAHTMLVADGYEAVFGGMSANEATQPTHSEYQFVRGEGHVIVEMQTEATLRYFPRPLNIDTFDNHLKQVSLGSGTTVSFSLEDTLILLAVHGAKHFWQRLLWIADIAELVQAPGGMDWQRLFARAEEMKVARMVHLALYVAHILLDAPLPEEVLRSVACDPGALALGGRIQETFNLTPVDPPVFHRFRFRVASRDSFWQGLRYAMQLATSPTDPDRKDLPLPGKISGMHRWLRPFLLVKRYGVRRSKPPATP